MWVVRHAVTAMYPEAEGLPGVASLDLDAFLAQYKRETNLLTWFGVVLGSWIFMLSPLVTIGLPVPSFLLTKAALDRHAHKAATHPWYLLRQIVFVVKIAGGMCWGQNARIREHYHLAPYEPDPGTWRKS